MEGECLSSCRVEKGSGKDVLSGVLVHVVVTAVNVDPAIHRIFFREPLQDVQHHFSLFGDASDRDAVNGSEIVRLSARVRIEKRLLQDYCRPVSRFQTVDNEAFELSGVGIRVVEAFGHDVKPEILGAAGRVNLGAELDRHQLLFFFCEELIELFDVLVGDLLD